MKNIIKAYDTTSEGKQIKGIAYYRLPREMKDFFEKCLENTEIVGFEWERGSYNFGIILSDK